MAEPKSLPFEAPIASEDWKAVEELWLAGLATEPVPTAALLDAAALLADEGESERAMTLVELLVETLEEAGDREGVLEAVEALVRLAGRNTAELLPRLEAAYAAARADRPSLRKVMAKFDLRSARRPLEVIAAMDHWLDLDQGTIVEVIGQGVGRVADLNLELENVKVEIAGKRPISMPFGAVARYLRRLGEGDFRRARVEDPEQLRQLVEQSPGEALARLLASLGEPADVAMIRAALEGLLPAEQWTSWWGKARKDQRILSSGSGSRLRYRISSTAATATEALVVELHAAAPRERLAIVRKLTGRGEEAAAEAARLLAESLASLEGTDPGLAWESATALRSLPGGEGPAAACHRRLLDAVDPAVLLAGIQDRASRVEVAEAIRRERPQEWSRVWAAWFLVEDNAANLDLAARGLAEAGADRQLEDALDTVFRNHLQHPARLVWACEAMTDETAPEVVRRRLTPSLLELIPDTLTRPEFAPMRGRAKSLLDRGGLAIRLLLEAASPTQASRFEGRIIRVSGLEVERVRLVEQAAHRARGSAAAPAGPVIVATRAAVDARRAELKELLEVEIPRTLLGIQSAAAEGDLRENFEYHMLRDRQELFSARAAKLQQELGTVRILEPGAANTEQVNIGTVVALTAADGSPLPPITIVGPWDSDVTKRLLADQSEVAQRLLGKSVGDEVEIDGVPMRIAGITAWNGER